MMNWSRTSAPSPERLPIRVDRRRFRRARATSPQTGRALRRRRHGTAGQRHRGSTPPVRHATTRRVSLSRLSQLASPSMRGSEQPHPKGLRQPVVGSVGRPCQLYVVNHSVDRSDELDPAGLTSSHPHPLTVSLYPHNRDLPARDSERAPAGHLYPVVPRHELCMPPSWNHRGAVGSLAPRLLSPALSAPRLPVESAGS